jgi:hypothetical protein
MGLGIVFFTFLVLGVFWTSFCFFYLKHASYWEINALFCKMSAKSSFYSKKICHVIPKQEELEFCLSSSPYPLPILSFELRPSHLVERYSITSATSPAPRAGQCSRAWCRLLALASWNQIILPGKPSHRKVIAGMTLDSGVWLLLCCILCMF